MKSSGALITLTSASEPSFTVVDKDSVNKIRLNQKPVCLATEYRLTNEDEIAFGDVIVTFVMDEEISATPMFHRLRSKPERPLPPTRSAKIFESSDDSSDTDLDIPNSCSVRKSEGDSVFWNSGRPPSIVRLLLEETGPGIDPDDVKIKNEEVDVHDALTQQSVSLSSPRLVSPNKVETQEFVSVPELSSGSEEHFPESQSLLLSPIHINCDHIYDAQTQPDVGCLKVDTPDLSLTVSKPKKDSGSQVGGKENSSAGKVSDVNIYDAATQPDYEKAAVPLASHNSLHPGIYDAMTQPNCDFEEAYFMPTQVTPPPPLRHHPSEMAKFPTPTTGTHYDCTQDVLNDLVEPSPVKKSIDAVFATPLDRVKRAVRKTALIPPVPDFSVSSLDLSIEADSRENYYDATQDILADLQSQKIPDDAVRTLGDRSALPSKNLLIDLTASVSGDADQESDGSASPLLCTSLTSLDSQEISRLAPISPPRMPSFSDRDLDISAEENSEPLVFRRSAPLRRKKSPSPPALPFRASKRARRVPVRLADVAEETDSPSAQPPNRKRKKNEKTRSGSPCPLNLEKCPASQSAPKTKTKPVNEIPPPPTVKVKTKPIDPIPPPLGTLRERTCRNQAKKLAKDSETVQSNTTMIEKRSNGRTRSSGTSPVSRIMFTGVNGERLPDIVRRLGGEVVTVDGQVLVAESVRRTFKLLIATAKGIPVVSPDWLLKSGRASRFLDTGLYTYKDVGDALGDKSLSGRRFPNGGCSILKDYLIFVTPGSKLPPDEIKQLLETLKGTAVLVKDGDRTEFECGIDKIHSITISSERDRKLWRHAPHPIFTADFVITAALTHSLSLTSGFYLER